MGPESLRARSDNPGAAELSSTALLPVGEPTFPQQGWGLTRWVLRPAKPSRPAEPAPSKQRRKVPDGRAWPHSACCTEEPARTPCFLASAHKFLRGRILQTWREATREKDNFHCQLVRKQPLEGTGARRPAAPTRAACAPPARPEPGRGHR